MSPDGRINGWGIAYHHFKPIVIGWWKEKYKSHGNVIRFDKQWNFDSEGWYHDGEM